MRFLDLWPGFSGFFDIQIMWHAIPGESTMKRRYDEVFLIIFSLQLKRHAVPEVLARFPEFFLRLGLMWLVSLRALFGFLRFFKPSSNVAHDSCRKRC